LPSGAVHPEGIGHGRPAISAKVGEIERRLRALEKSSEKIGTHASSSARDKTKGVGDAVASALADWADRFRWSANALGDQSAVMSKDAARLEGPG
jgi:hypothetical protein